MRYAYATKTHLKLWRCADKPQNFTHEHWNTFVQFSVDTKDGGIIEASLSAGNGFVSVLKGIHAEPGAGKQAFRIPRAALEQAERVMGKKDLAYIEGSRIEVVSLRMDDHTGEEIEQTKAIVPFTIQTEFDFGDEKTGAAVVSIEEPHVGSTALIDVKRLQAALAQFQDSGAGRHMRIGVTHAGVTLSAGMSNEAEQIIATVQSWDEEHQNNLDIPRKHDGQ